MLADFSIAPLDKGHKNLGQYVAIVLDIIRKSGLEYHLHSMGTVVEGKTEEVFDLIKLCHMSMLEHSDRVYTVIKIDDRKNSANRIEDKVKSVRKHFTE